MLGTQKTVSWRGYHIQKYSEGDNWLAEINYGSVNGTKAFWNVVMEDYEHSTTFVVGNAGRTNWFRRVSPTFYSEQHETIYGQFFALAPYQLLTTRTLPDWKVRQPASYTLTGILPIDEVSVNYDEAGLLRFTVTAAYDKATTIKLNNNRLRYEEVQSFIQSNLVANGYSDITTNYWLPPFFPNTP